MRVMLADDQPRVRFALRLLLSRQPGLEIVGEASDAADLFGQIEAVRPDLLLLDWELPGLVAAGGVSALYKTHPMLRVVALSGHPEALRAALESGAQAFVSKADPPELLLAELDRQKHLA